MDRVLIGSSDADTGSSGLWVSKSGINVISYASNTYLVGTSAGPEGLDPDGKVFPIYAQNYNFNWTGISTYNYGWIDENSLTSSRVHTTYNGTLRFVANVASPFIVKVMNTSPNFPSSFSSVNNGENETFHGNTYPLVEIRLRRPKKNDGSDWTTSDIASHNSDLKILWRSSNSTYTTSEDSDPFSENFSIRPNSKWDDVLGTSGEWATLEYDLKNKNVTINAIGTTTITSATVEGNVDWISNTMIDAIKFEPQENHHDETEPDIEIDYIRIKKAGIPINFGNSIENNLIFNSDWYKPTGLVHQTGTVVIGTEYTWANGAAKPSGTSHLGSQSGRVEFPKLPYVPVVLFQRIDDRNQDLFVSFPAGDKEFSVAHCDIVTDTQVWNPLTKQYQPSTNTSYGSEYRTFAYVRSGIDHFDLNCRNAIARDGYEWLFNYTPQEPYIELYKGGNYDPESENPESFVMYPQTSQAWRVDTEGAQDGGQLGEFPKKGATPHKPWGGWDEVESNFLAKQSGDNLFEQSRPLLGSTSSDDPVGTLSSGARFNPQSVYRANNQGQRSHPSVADSGEVDAYLYFPTFDNGLYSGPEWLHYIKPSNEIENVDETVPGSTSRKDNIFGVKFYDMPRPSTNNHMECIGPATALFGNPEFDPNFLSIATNEDESQIALQSPGLWQGDANSVHWFGDDSSSGGAFAVGRMKPGVLGVRRGHIITTDNIPTEGWDQKQGRNSTMPITINATAFTEDGAIGVEKYQSLSEALDWSARDYMDGKLGYFANFTGTDAGNCLPTFDWANKFGDWNVPQFNNFYQYDKTIGIGSYTTFKDAIGTSWTADNTKFLDDSMWLGFANNRHEYKGDIWHPQSPTKTYDELSGMFGYGGTIKNQGDWAHFAGFGLNYGAEYGNNSRGPWQWADWPQDGYLGIQAVSRYDTYPSGYTLENQKELGFRGPFYKTLSFKNRHGYRPYCGAAQFEDVYVDMFRYYQRFDDDSDDKKRLNFQIFQPYRESDWTTWAVHSFQNNWNEGPEGTVRLKEFDGNPLKEALSDDLKKHIDETSAPGPDASDISKGNVGSTHFGEGPNNTWRPRMPYTDIHTIISADYAHTDSGFAGPGTHVNYGCPHDYGRMGAFGASINFSATNLSSVENLISNITPPNLFWHDRHLHEYPNIHYPDWSMDNYPTWEQTLGIENWQESLYAHTRRFSTFDSHLYIDPNTWEWYKNRPHYKEYADYRWSTPWNDYMQPVYNVLDREAKDKNKWSSHLGFMNVNMQSDSYGSWYSDDHLPAIISPPPGATLSGSSQTFTWEAGATDEDPRPIVQWLLVAFGLNGEYYGSGSTASFPGTTTTGTLESLPTDGSVVVVRITSQREGPLHGINNTSDLENVPQKFYYTAHDDAPAATTTYDGNPNRHTFTSPGGNLKYGNKLTKGTAGDDSFWNSQNVEKRVHPWNTDATPSHLMGPGAWTEPQTGHFGHKDSFVVSRWYTYPGATFSYDISNFSGPAHYNAWYKNDQTEEVQDYKRRDYPQLYEGGWGNYGYFPTQEQLDQGKGATRLFPFYGYEIGPSENPAPNIYNGIFLDDKNYSMRHGRGPLYGSNHNSFNPLGAAATTRLNPQNQPAGATGGSYGSYGTDPMTQPNWWNGGFPGSPSGAFYGSISTSPLSGTEGQEFSTLLQGPDVIFTKTALLANKDTIAGKTTAHPWSNFSGWRDAQSRPFAGFDINPRVYFLPNKNHLGKAVSRNFGIPNEIAGDYYTASKCHNERGPHPHAPTRLTASDPFLSQYKNDVEFNGEDALFYGDATAEAPHTKNWLFHLLHSIDPITYPQEVRYLEEYYHPTLNPAPVIIALDRPQPSAFYAPEADGTPTFDPSQDTIDTKSWPGWYYGLDSQTSSEGGPGGERAGHKARHIYPDYKLNDYLLKHGIDVAQLDVGEAIPIQEDPYFAGMAFEGINSTTGAFNAHRFEFIIKKTKSHINHFRQSYEYNLPGKSPHRADTLRPIGYGLVTNHYGFDSFSSPPPAAHSYFDGRQLGGGMSILKNNYYHVLDDAEWGGTDFTIGHSHNLGETRSSVSSGSSSYLSLFGRERITFPRYSFIRYNDGSLTDDVVDMQTKSGTSFQGTHPSVGNSYFNLALNDDEAPALHAANYDRDLYPDYGHNIFYRGGTYSSPTRRWDVLSGSSFTLTGLSTSISRHGRDVVTEGIIGAVEVANAFFTDYNATFINTHSFYTLGETEENVFPDPPSGETAGQTNIYGPNRDGRGPANNWLLDYNIVDNLTPTKNYYGLGGKTLKYRPAKSQGATPETQMYGAYLGTPWNRWSDTRPFFTGFSSIYTSTGNYWEHDVLPGMCKADNALTNWGTVDLSKFNEHHIGYRWHNDAWYESDGGPGEIRRSIIWSPSGANTMFNEHTWGKKGYGKDPLGFMEPDTMQSAIDIWAEYHGFPEDRHRVNRDYNRHHDNYVTGSPSPSADQPVPLVRVNSDGIPQASLTSINSGDTLAIANNALGAVRGYRHWLKEEQDGLHGNPALDTSIYDGGLYTNGVFQCTNSRQDKYRLTSGQKGGCYDGFRLHERPEFQPVSGDGRYFGGVGGVDNWGGTSYNTWGPGMCVTPTIKELKWSSIQHPFGIVPDENVDSNTFYGSTSIENQTSYIGGAPNMRVLLKDDGTNYNDGIGNKSATPKNYDWAIGGHQIQCNYWDRTLKVPVLEGHANNGTSEWHANTTYHFQYMYDETKINPPKYRYWVLRIPASLEGHFGELGL